MCNIISGSVIIIFANKSIMMDDLVFISELLGIKFPPKFSNSPLKC